jgi:alternate signal-mediated exported protein
MNKTTKASVATAAGIVLLLGGAGSLAYWTDSTTSGTSQVVNSGTLTVTSNPDGAWTKSFNGGTSSAVALGTFKMVPGDKLTYTQTFNVTATGQDLFFTISATNPTLSGDANMIGRLTASFGTPSLSSTTLALTGTTAGVYKVTAAGGSGTGTITVTWSLDWPFAGAPASDNTAKGVSVTLGTGQVLLTQVGAA